MKQDKLKIYIDEAGRGPLAGPLYVGAVLPLKIFRKKIFKDSKKISAKVRESLFDKAQILEGKASLLYGVGIITSKEIDKLRLTQCINLGVLRAILQIFRKYFKIIQNTTQTYCSCDTISMLTIDNLLAKENPTKEDSKLLLEKIQDVVGKDIELFIDGNTDFGIQKDYGINTTTIIKGDDKISEISIASILAKVSRDKYLVDVLDKKYPKYGFAKHKGYGTKYHIEQIHKLGKCEEHRELFLGKLV